MSWSEGFQDVSADDIFNLAPQQEHTSSTPEMLEQFESAVNALIRLVDSKVVGDPYTARFNITMSGHANPNHEVTPGWGNDFIALSINQLTPTPEVPDGGTEKTA